MKLSFVRNTKQSRFIGLFLLFFLFLVLPLLIASLRQPQDIRQHAAGGGAPPKGTMFDLREWSYDGVSLDAAGMKSDFDDAKNAGVTWIRFAPTPGNCGNNGCYPSNGVMDQAVAMANADGITLEILMPYVTNTTTVTNFVNRYKASIHYWEYGNEPNLESPTFDPVTYANDLKTVRNAIKGVDSNAVVLSAGLSEWQLLGDWGGPGWNSSWLKGFLDTGICSVIDAIPVHPYRQTVDDSYTRYTQLADAIHGYSGCSNMPVWMNEIGFNTMGFNPNAVGSEQEKADDIVALWGKFRSGGVPGPLFLYTLHELNDYTSGFGMESKDPNHSKPTVYQTLYYSYKNLWAGESLAPVVPAYGGGSGGGTTPTQSQPTPTSKPGSTPTPTSVSTSGGKPTVFIVMVENTNWSDVKGSSSMPYVNKTLLPNYAHAENYVSGNHPSLPNYVFLEAGSNLGLTDGAYLPTDHSSSTTNHLTTLLNKNGISWKYYAENLPGNGTTCNVSDPGTPYSEDHNPFVYFDDVRNNASYCIAHERPFTEFAGDLSNNTTASYNFIVPNDYDQGEKPANNNACLLCQADTFLSTQIPKIQASQAYKNNGVILVLWDENAGDATSPHGLIVVSNLAKKNYANSISYSHASTLRTMQEIFGVTPLLGAAASATDLSDLFTSLPTSSGSTATPTPAPGSTSVAVTMKLHGIGTGGDSVNPSSAGNTALLHTQRTATITFTNAANQTLSPVTGQVTYNTSVGAFQGTASVPSLPAGSYTVKVKTDFFLQAQIPGIVAVTSGQSVILPSITLIAGDINNDNKIDILDYNLLVGCYSDFSPAKSCTSAQKTATDLTDDGKVNSSDLNLFLREISVRTG